MKQGSDNLYTKKNILLFLKIFLSLSLLVIVPSYLYFNAIKNAHLSALKQKEQFRVDVQSQAFKDEFKNIASDLIVLTSHRELWDAINGVKTLNLDALEYEFRMFSRTKDIYDQVRLLDLQGNEKIRININKYGATIVDKKSLQNKAQRYYFLDTLDLEQGEIYVSPFDLNVEKGQIEVPYKPTIRFGMPIFDLNKKKQGVVILNYLGVKLIDKLHGTVSDVEKEGHDILINSDGYFLKGLAASDEWGFMFNEREDKTFNNLFDDAASTIFAQQSGQIMTDDGLFTFTTLYPLFEELRSSSGSAEAFGKSVKKLAAEKYYWKLVSFVPTTKITAISSKYAMTLIIFNVLFIIVLFVATWLVIRFFYFHQKAEQKIKNLAHYDQLTQLPNRSLLIDRLRLGIASAKRDNIPLYVLFIDLDGFKTVNDTYGHDAGDYALLEISKRLSSCVRNMDTVARLGGDEFVMLIKTNKGKKLVNQIASRTIAEVSKPIFYQGHMCYLGCSIGISIYPENGEEVDILIQQADKAMYHVKETGKNNFYYA
jgi:diguanylate cyclase (GGDEF)-like protein